MMIVALFWSAFHTSVGEAQLTKEPNAANATSHSFLTLNWDEIRPSAMQTEALLADMPQGRAVVNAKTNDLWIVGKSHLWRWGLRDGSVSRVVLPPERVVSLQLLYASDQFVYGVDGQGAWMFDLTTKNWRRLDGRFDATCKTNSVLPFKPADEHSLFFVTDCGIFVLLLKSKQLVAAGGDKLMANPQKAVTLVSIADGDDKSLLALYNQEIFRLSTKGTKIRKELIYTAKSPVLGVVRTGDWFAAWSRQAIMIFDQKMVRQQVIPVLGTRSITSFAGTATRHAVGFSDGTIELMDLPSKKKWVTSKADFPNQFLDFSDDGSLLILSLESGMPRVFAMSHVN
jgi:hypothetical protein